MRVQIDRWNERLTRRSGMWSSVPKARLIPAWGSAPGMRRDVVVVRAEGPTYPRPVMPMERTVGPHQSQWWLVTWGAAPGWYGTDRWSSSISINGGIEERCGGEGVVG